MYQQHYIFSLPQDDNSKIWRYLDFAKFVALLEFKALYFCRADKFEDPFEGVLPETSNPLIEDFFKDLDNKDDTIKTFKMLTNELRKLTLVNCWHINNFESDAMWKLYAKNDIGLAIQSSVKNLINAFSNTKEDIYIGKVKYIDYEKDLLNDANAFTPYIHKRKSFEHENELRALLLYNDMKEDEMKLDEAYKVNIPEHGQNISVDIHQLIENIYVAPMSPPWFLQLVNKVLEKYELNKPVIQSKLYLYPSSNAIDTKQESVYIQKGLFEFFSKKDAERVKAEMEQKDRLLKSQFEAAMISYNELREKIAAFEYKGYKGGDALHHFASEIIDSKDMNNIFNNPFFRKVYFLTGSFDVLFDDISNTVLTVDEKFILFKKLFHLYTLNLVPVLTNFALQSKIQKIDDEHLQIAGLLILAFNKFKSFMDTHSI